MIIELILEYKNGDSKKKRWLQKLQNGKHLKTKRVVN